MMSNKRKFTPSIQTVKMLSAATVEAIMDNRATAIGRVGEFAVAALCRNVQKDIHSVALVEAVGNDVSIDIFNDWDEAMKKFGVLVRGT